MSVFAGYWFQRGSPRPPFNQGERRTAGEAFDSDEAEAAANVFTMASGVKAVYVDSVTGQPLDSALVNKARALELDYFESKRVWEKRPYAEAVAKLGKRAISVRWVDTNKGD